MLKIAENDIIQRAEEAIRRLLVEIPFLQPVSFEAERIRPSEGLDFSVRVRGSEDEWRIVVQVKVKGEPRFARVAAAELLRYCASYSRAYGVVVASYVSPAAAQICRTEGVGYLDLSGNCRLSFGNVFVEREGQPNKFAKKRDLRTLYSPKASRILRILLAEPHRSWAVMELAKQAGVSLGLASNVKKLLEDREWVVRQPGGIFLTEAEKLLREWSENYSFQRSKTYDYYSLTSTSKVESGLAQVCSQRQVRYALTAFSSAARMTPMVRYQRVFAYVDGDLQEVASELDLKKVTSGPNVTLLQPYDTGVFLGARQIKGVCTVSPVQTYLDLCNLKGRGEEAAQAIMAEVIKPQW